MFQYCENNNNNNNNKKNEPVELVKNPTFNIRTVAIAFFLVHGNACKTHVNDLETDVWATVKRSFAFLANQIIVSETFQAFRILANQISVRKSCHGNRVWFQISIVYIFSQ